MEVTHLVYLLPIAFGLDYLIGDPPRFPHPIRWMGKAIEYFEPRFRKLPISLTLSGACFALFLIVGVWAISFFIIKGLHQIHPFWGRLGEVLMIYYCLAVRDLQKSSMAVYEPLSRGDLETARSRVAMIVGRDVTQLDGNAVARATVETVAENLVDGVISPLFYAAVGGAPLALAFKMASTLDSMVGYKNDVYMEFGKVSARIDDALNYIPARVSAVVIALASKILSGRGKPAFLTAIREGKKHKSPNAGWPEAAFAGALSVKLGGPNIYFGKIVEKPYIGEGFGEVRITDIPKACDLMMLSSLIWLMGVLAGLSLF